MTLDEFASANTPTEGGDTFQRQTRELLAVALDGSVTALAGSMVAYSGSVAITTRSDPAVPEPPVNRSLSDPVGQSSDETYQLSFGGGDGFVIQQFEKGP